MAVETNYAELCRSPYPERHANAGEACLMVLQDVISATGDSKIQNVYNLCIEARCAAHDIERFSPAHNEAHMAIQDAFATCVSYLRQSKSDDIPFGLEKTKWFHECYCALQKLNQIYAYFCEHNTHDAQLDIPAPDYASQQSNATLH